MWPYSDSGSRILSAPPKPKVHINLDGFAVSDKVLDATLSPDIWTMIEWLSATTDTTLIDVIRSLLFQALYGHIAYEQLIEHAQQRQRAEALKSDSLSDNSSASDMVQSQNIKWSPARGTPADIEHIGKANIRRKLLIPHRMWFDLDRQAAKANLPLTTYVRGLLYKALQGEVNFSQWQLARAELENQVKPPATK